MVEFRGVYPALVTPSDANGGIDVAALEQLVDYLLEKQADGFYIGGSTGEGIYMPLEERKQLTEVVLRRVDGCVPVIVHVGTMAANDAVVLAQHAESCGAAGFASIIPPHYNTPAAVIAYYRTLAAASALPFFSYIFNPNADPVTVMRGLIDVPNLIGAKYTGPNMYEMRLIMEMNGGRWITFSGMDEQCVYAAMMGAHGCIGSTLNFMPGVYRAIRDAVARGDHEEAQALQVRANRVIAAMAQYEFPASLRLVLSMIGIECGSPRLPALPLSIEAQTSLRRALDATDFEALVAM